MSEQRISMRYDCGCVVNALPRGLPERCPNHSDSEKAELVGWQQDPNAPVSVEQPYDKSRYDLSIPGWMSQHELHWLHDMARRMHTIVEIGSYQGRSAYALLRGLLPHGGHLHCVDPWQGLWLGQPNNYPVFMRHMTDRFTAEELTHLQAYPISSAEAVSLFSNLLVDAVFIDGDHLEPGFRQDIQLWLPKTRKLICGHDFRNTDWPAVEKVVCEIFPDRWQNPVDWIWSVSL
jgi:methyltransferase family protein